MIKKRTAAVVMAMALMITGCASNEKKSDKSTKKNDTKITQEASSDSSTDNDTTKKSDKKDKTDKGTEKSTESSKSKTKKVDKVETKATVPAYSYTATKTGSLDGKSLYTHSGFAYKTNDDKSINVYLADGTLFPQDGTLSNVEYIGEGLYEARKSSADSVNTVALIDTKGEIIIPFEAASIDWLKSEDETQHRFLKVIYTTEPTSSKDDCFIYFTSNPISLGPKDGDLYYKGYAKIFDFEKKQFIPDLKITNRDSYCVEAIKGGVVYADEDGKKTLYSADGKAVVSTDKYNFKTDGTVVIVTDKDYNNTVYNGDGSILLETKDSLATIGGQGTALASYDKSTGKRILIDYNGNKLSDKDFVTAYDISAGIVRITQDSSGLSSLINLDGSVIVDNKKSLYSLIPGYYYYTTDDDKKAIINADGEICPNCQSIYDMVAYNDEGSYFVWNKKEYSLKLNKDTLRNVSIGLVYAKNDEGKYGLYDLFTGNMILEGLYDDMKVSGAFAYGYNSADQKWDIYVISGNVPEK